MYASMHSVDESVPNYDDGKCESLFGFDDAAHAQVTKLGSLILSNFDHMISMVAWSICVKGR